MATFYFHFFSCLSHFLFGLFPLNCGHADFSVKHSASARLFTNISRLWTRPEQPGKMVYFMRMMLKKSPVIVLENKIVNHPTTLMMSHVWTQVVNFDHLYLSWTWQNHFCWLFKIGWLLKARRWGLMTSHLESCKGHTGEQMKLLQVLMQRMKDAPDDVYIPCRGATNLRDTEVCWGLSSNQTE